MRICCSKQASLAVLIALSVAFAVSGCAERIDTVDEFVQLGRLNERREDYAAAAQAYSDAIRLASEDPTLWYDRGVAYFEMGETEKALADYSRAIELDAEFAIAWTNRSAVRLGMDDLTGAIDDCTAAIDIDPLDPLPWRNRGLAYYRLGLIAESIDDLTQSIRIEPDDAFSLVSRGIAYLDAGQLRLAIDDLTASIELDDTAPEPWLSRAIAKQRLNDSDGAARDLKQAVELGANVNGRDAAKLAEARHPPLPAVVREHLKTLGYERKEDGWQRGSDPVRIVAKALASGRVVRFHEGELDLIRVSKPETVLVAFEMTDGVVRIVTTLEHWIPDPDNMRAVELELPITD